MKGLLRIVLLLSIVLVGSDLGQGAEPAPKTPTTDYFPLTVGNTWHYRAGQSRFSLKVTKMEKVEKGKAEAARLDFIVNGKSVAYENVGVTDKAVVRYTFEGKALTPPIPFLQLPPKKGAAWNVESKFESKAEDLKQVLKGGFKITNDKLVIRVGNLSFSTVVVEGKDLDVNGTKLSITYYFADKIGMVREIIEMAGGQRVVIDLEKFEEGKK